MAMTGAQRQRRYYRQKLRKPNPKVGRPIRDLKHRTFGCLLVMKMDHAAPRGANIPIRWIVRCQCGTKLSVSGRALVQGRQRSCGCRKGRGGRLVPSGWRQLVDWRAGA